MDETTHRTLFVLVVMQGHWIPRDGDCAPPRVERVPGEDYGEGWRRRDGLPARS